MLPMAELTTVGETTQSCLPYSLVRQHRRMLANLNIYLEKDASVLDFGCGTGAAVYEYRHAGYDAYGFDIRDAVVRRERGDDQFFRFALTGQPPNIPECRIDSSSYEVPFEDERFDFLFSTSTLEHVMDHDTIFPEMARVLRRGGASIHTFPARWGLIEPHMKVPLGGVIQHPAWFSLWAKLGVRNEFQSCLTSRDCVEQNMAYSKSGLKYVPVNRLCDIGRKHFREVELIPRLWELSDRGNGSFKAAALVAPGIHRCATWLYSRFCTVVLFLRK
jgi:SAM-dependent methyltransferase